MSDQVLNILKLSLLGLVYLFFARVLWAVWSEVRAPAARPAGQQPAPQPQPAAVSARERARDATPVAGGREHGAAVRPAKGKGGLAARLVIVEPKHRRGTALAIDGEITLGRADTCTITIDDDTYVSTLHLRVYDYDGQPMVEDLGSTNGTFHNGNKLHGSKVLQPGDRIQVGTTVIEAQ